MTFEEDLQGFIFRGGRSTRDMFIRAVRLSFPESGCILEHQIFRFAEMILHDRRSTSYDPIALFCGRHSSLDRWTGQIAKRIGTRPSALHSTYHFWRRSRRFFWCCQLKKWGGLAELLRFLCGQLPKMRKSRRIASFLMLSSLKKEKVSQNS